MAVTLPLILPTPQTPSLNEAERAAGLTHPLPAGERILWQGAPDRRLLGARVFRFRLLGLYVVLAMAFVMAAAVQGGWPVGQAIGMTLLALPCAAAGALVLVLLGALMARTTRYTLTNRRIILHIGVAYDRTVSIPLSAVVDARIRPGFREQAISHSPSRTWADSITSTCGPMPAPGTSCRRNLRCARCPMRKRPAN